MKKLGILGAVIIVLFGGIIILTNLANKEKLADNPYGTDNLKQTTIDLLNNESYQNIILPEALEEKIDSGKPVLAYFFSPECSHCRNFTPYLMEQAEKHEVQIDQLNLLEFDEWDTYNIDSTPTLIYFNDGEEVERLMGDYSTHESHQNELKQFLENVDL